MPDSDEKPVGAASTDGKRPAEGAVPFSASPYKKLPGAQPSWIKMDLSLLPKEIAEELGMEFDSVDPATTGSAKTLPEKLRPTLDGSDEEDDDEGGFLADQTSGLISQLLAANWENAPDALKRDIKKFLDSEISRSLAITKSINGGLNSGKERVRLRTPERNSPKPKIGVKYTLPSMIPEFPKDEGGWGDGENLDKLIS